jgi:uncharacterized protein
MHSATLPAPWYRQFWPWFIISIPASSILVGITLLTLAIRHPDPLVVDNYYKEGLAINQQLDRQQLAAEIGVQALVRFDAERELLSIEALEAGRLQGPLQLFLIHPTLAGQDRIVSLRADEQGRYSLSMPESGNSRWHIALESEAEGWRLEGRIRLAENTQLLLSHGL